MKYRVVFRDRSDGTGEPSEEPVNFLDSELDDETILSATFVERTGPDAIHSSDTLEEDDAFLSIGTEVWEYDVADGKDKTFKEALQNSGVVIEFEPLEAADELGLS